MLSVCGWINLPTAPIPPSVSMISMSFWHQVPRCHIWSLKRASWDDVPSAKPPFWTSTWTPLRSRSADACSGWTTWLWRSGRTSVSKWDSRPCLDAWSRSQKCIQMHTNAPRNGQEWWIRAIHFKTDWCSLFWGGYSIYIYVYICLIMSQVSRGVSNSYSSINKPDINLYLWHLSIQ